MVERKICTFCGTEIEPGTGRMYIKKDGVVYNFCTSKCFKNLVVLGRVPRRTTWTRHYEHEKEIRMRGVPTEEDAEPKAKKVRKVVAKPEDGKAETKAEKKPEETKPAPKEEKPKPEEKKPAPKEPAKKDKPAPKKAEPAHKETPKVEAKPKPTEGAEE
jgi:large subunit ribosomal protein L24e